MNKKLSEAQKTVIKRMQQGEKLHWIQGLNARCFFDAKKSVSWPTIFKLEELGLIKRIGNEIYLTQQGKDHEL